MNWYQGEPKKYLVLPANDGEKKEWLLYVFNVINGLAIGFLLYFMGISTI